MSLQFSDTLTYKGIVQLYERECGFDYGTVSNNPTALKSFTADANIVMDDFVNIALRASGKWQYDDTNQTKYPIITTDINAGQRDYTFLKDEQSNFILDVYKVFLKNTSSNSYQEIYPIDVNTNDDKLNNQTDSFTNGLNATGSSNLYDKLGNTIFLNYLPATTIAGGLKVYVNREGQYFTYTDTTRYPGVPGLFHKYFALKPALAYARRNNTSNLAPLQAEVLRLEGSEDQGIIGEIARYFGARERDTHRRMKAMRQDNK